MGYNSETKESCSMDDYIAIAFTVAKSLFTDLFNHEILRNFKTDTMNDIWYRLKSKEGVNPAHFYANY